MRETMQTSLLLPKNATQLFISGPAGQLDCLRLDTAALPIKGVAIIFHPDPMGGGTYTNKIVQTVAKTLNGKGYVCYCPNLRGVGMSDGVHDYGTGEIDDALAIYEYVTKLHTDLPCILAGFSFGGAIAANLATKVMHKKLILVAPSVIKHSVTVDPSKTIVIHGVDDEVISFDDTLNWAKGQNQSIISVPNTGHFFHGKLVELTNIISGFDL
ncbi:MAG: alpha/beta hydrolase [Burkholderiales bacterium]|jgi:alpha/beta superfamily hydrolase|nr:alpha/beta hydrolase [Burkholderiales bacterium]